MGKKESKIFRDRLKGKNGTRQRSDSINFKNRR